MIKMGSQLPPQAKPAGIESAHKHHALDQNTSYFNFDSGNFWSIKPDSVFSYFLYKKSRSVYLKKKKHNIFLYKKIIICLFKEKKT